MRWPSRNEWIEECEARDLIGKIKYLSQGTWPGSVDEERIDALWLQLHRFGHTTEVCEFIKETERIAEAQRLAKCVRVLK